MFTSSTLQPSGAGRSHRDPAQPGQQLHRPVEASQAPFPEHSAASRGESGTLCVRRVPEKFLLPSGGWRGGKDVGRYATACAPSEHGFAGPDVARMALSAIQWRSSHRATSLLNPQN